MSVGRSKEIVSVSPSETPNAELSASAATSETSCGARLVRFGVRVRVSVRVTVRVRVKAGCRG